MPARSAGVSRPPADDDTAAPWNNTWADRAPAPSEPTEPTAAADSDIAAAGEAALLRKLRTRSLSEREARSVLHACGVDEASAEGIIERFRGNCYLDDAKLAEQLVHSAVDRKGQGRMAVSQTLTGRGIPREVIDAALAQLPDDERERALAFARSKARAMSGLDSDVALRRLAGQLARRGYGAVAFDAARKALDEQSRPRAGVRFEP